MYSQMHLRIQAFIDTIFLIAVWIVAAHMFGAGWGFLIFVAASGLHDIGYALRTVSLALKEKV